MHKSSSSIWNYVLWNYQKSLIVLSSHGLAKFRKWTIKRSLFFVCIIMWKYKLSWVWNFALIWHFLSWMIFMKLLWVCTVFQKSHPMSLQSHHIWILKKNSSSKINHCWTVYWGQVGFRNHVGVWTVACVICSFIISLSFLICCYSCA